VELQGHRGARGLAPENTLPAFLAALRVGVHVLELDVGLTRDGVVVIGHDPTLNPDIVRDADGRFLEARGPAIASLSFAELQRYDVGRIKPGTRYAGLYPAQQGADGVRMPRLADLFALVKERGDTSVRFNIETKLSPLAPQQTAAPEVMARALIDAVRAAGVAARTTIQSFDWRTLAVVQKEAPDIPTVYLSAQQNWLDNIGAGKPEPSPWTAGIAFAAHGSVAKMVKAAGGRIWSPFFGDLDAAKLAEAKALGLKVVVWTVNDPAQIERMLELGVDGVITDRPDLAREVMQRRGLPLPAPR
jgi:glycerophosphoryl diester phosphodiesterase